MGEIECGVAMKWVIYLPEMGSIYVSQDPTPSVSHAQAYANTSGSKVFKK